MNIKKLKELKKNKKGFTLIEIIVVIVILAVLLAVAVPSVLNYLNEADSAKLMANARAVMTTAQAEVVKQDVSADGLTKAELDILLDGTKDASIVKLSGVDGVEVKQLYTGKVTVDEKNTTVTAGVKFEDAIKGYTPDGGAAVPANNKPELSAVEMKFGNTTVIAVLNGQIYVGD